MRSSRFNVVILWSIILATHVQPGWGFLLPRFCSRQAMQHRPIHQKSSARPIEGSLYNAATVATGSPIAPASMDPPVTPASGSSPTAHLFGLPRGERTYRILETVENSDEAGGAGSGLSVASFQGMEKAWEMVKNMPSGKQAGPAPVFVRESDVRMGIQPEFDAVVCGGTLGIFMAGALQQKGFRVCVVERGVLKGRTQEWNISRRELRELVKQGVVSEAELEECISSEFNPIRVGFLGEHGESFELYTKDVLNLGVSPALLVERALSRFVQAGGVVKQETGVGGITIHPDMAVLNVLKTGHNITTRLVIDSMGHMSPITRQCRWGEKPDGICMVVGSCASGFDPARNQHGDLLYSNTPILDKGQTQMQYFWEAFPTSSGPTDRTTYMFTYFDADPLRPKLIDVVEDYWDLMPKYQGVSASALRFKRVLCGFFPTFRRSPLKTHFDRICSIGDASGMQSPLSFGGFGALTRHLPRLTCAFTEALQGDCLSRAQLRLINGYQPNLAATWLFQRSMGVPVGNRPSDPHLINRILTLNFRAFLDLGESVLKPFLQDVVQLVPLSKAMMRMAFCNPISMLPIMSHIGLRALLRYLRHYFMMAIYTLMHHVSRALGLQAILTGRLRYLWNRHRERWTYGAGLDYSPAAAPV